MRVDTKIFSIFLAVFLLFFFVSVQSIYAARRYLVGTGNFNNTAIWSTTSGGSGGASVPTSADWVVLDANSNDFVVTLVSVTTIDSLSIAAGTFNTSSFRFTVRGPTELTSDSLLMGSGQKIFTGDLNVSGGFLDFGSATVDVLGDFNISNGVFNAGNSTLRFSGLSGIEQTLSAGISLTLNNVTVSQSYLFNPTAGVIFDNSSLGGIIITINGTLNMVYPDQEGLSFAASGGIFPPFLIYGQNAKLLYSSNNPGNASAQLTGDEFSSTVVVNDLEISVTNFTNGVDLTGLGNKSVRRDLTLSAGQLTQGSSETLSVGGTLTTGTLTTTGSYVGGTLQMTGNQSQSIIAGSGSISNLTINKTNSTDVVNLVTQILNISGNFVVQNGIFELGPGSNGLNLTSGSSVLRVQAGGTFRTGGKQISNAGSYDLQTGSTFEFTGVSQEQTPSGMTFSNLRMSNPGGLNIVGNVIVNGSLQFNADNNIVVSGGVNTLTIGPAGSISGYNSSRFILGPMRKQFIGTGSFTFPIGIEELSTFYLRPASFNYTNGTFGGTSTIRVQYTRASFTPKTLPVGISQLDPTGHYQVTEVGTAPSAFTYNFAGTFDDGNFSPESRNHALVETITSYTVGASNVVDDVNNTVTSGPFSELPVVNHFIVFGAGSVSGGIAWDGGGDGTSWSDANNWNPDAVPTSTDDVTIDQAVTVNIGGTTAAVAQTLALGGTNNPTLVVGGTSSNPLRIYQTTGTPLTMNNASILQIVNSQGIKFDPDNTNQYDPNRTDYLGTSTVEYQTGIVQADEYQNLIVNGALSSSSSGNIVVNLNFEKQSANSFTASIPMSIIGTYTNTEGVASFTGGLTMNGTDFTVNGGSIGGTVIFSGSIAQNINGTANPAVFSIITLNNSNGLTLNTPVQVSSSLNLTNGLLTTTSNLLTLVGSASTSGNDNSFVYGPLARTNATGSKDFPIGKGFYRPVTTSLSGSSPTVQFEVFDTSPTQNFQDPLVLISQVRYWLGTINSGTVSSGSVSLNYGDDDGVQLGDSLRVAYSPDQSTTAYISIGGSGSSSGAGTITGNLPSNALGYFTLGTISFDNSLPVDLVTFIAVGRPGKILLNWETASEVNNMGFDLYRSESASGIYNKINEQIIQGNGNSNTSNYYEYEDTEVLEGQTYYYKLYSRDFDGSIHDYGKLTSATVEPLPKTFALAQNYPNPFNPATRLKFDVPKQAEISIEIYNMLGQKVRTLVNNEVYQPGVYDNIIWNARDDRGNQVANGIYYMVFSARNFDFRQVRKLVFMK